MERWAIDLKLTFENHVPQVDYQTYMGTGTGGASLTPYPSQGVEGLTPSKGIEIFQRKIAKNNELPPLHDPWGTNVLD